MVSFQGILSAALLGYVAAQHDAAEDRHGLGFEDEASRPSPAEFERLFKDHFNQIDANGDGTLEWSEFEGRFRSHMDTRFKKLAEKFATENREKFDNADIGKNGRLSKSEFIDAHGSALEITDDFNFFDGDVDGQITWDEYQEYLDPYKSDRRMQYIDMRAAKEMDAIGGAEGTKTIEWEQFKKWSHYDDDSQYTAFLSHDKNGDQKLDGAEYGTWHAAMWTQDSKDPVTDELAFIMHTITDHKHQSEGNDPKAVESIRVTFEDAKKHSEFFVGWHKNAHAEL